MAAQGLVGDRRDELAQAPLQAGALFGRVEALALGLPLEQHFRQRLGAAQDFADRLRAARARDDRPGSWPSGSMAKRRLLPAPISGSAVSMARNAALWPALSPSKQRIGSLAMLHSSAHCSGVSAVPSGATVWGKPAWVIAITST